MPAYLGQKNAQQLDQDLMSDEGAFKLEQVRVWLVYLPETPAT
jgi:hypothetical protein